MTDKEILNEYCEKECKDFLHCGYSNKKHCPCHKGIKYGLAEGRKERNCVNCSNHGKQFEVMKLEKEKAELKAQFEEEHSLLTDIIESFTSESLTDDFEMASTAREIAEILEIKNYR